MLSSLYGATIKSSVSTLSTNIKCTKSGKSSLSVNTPLLQDIFFSITMQGQQVKVNYENITNSLPVILQEYFRMQGVQHLNLTIKGEFNGKRAKLKKISCNNGVCFLLIHLKNFDYVMQSVVFFLK